MGMIATCFGHVHVVFVLTSLLIQQQYYFSLFISFWQVQWFMCIILRHSLVAIILIIHASFIFKQLTMSDTKNCRRISTEKYEHVYLNLITRQVHSKTSLKSNVSLQRRRNSFKLYQISKKKKKGLGSLTLMLSAVERSMLRTNWPLKIRKTEFALFIYWKSDMATT